MMPSLCKHVLPIVIVAGSLSLGACGRDQPLAPGQGHPAPGRPSATLNPACSRVQGQTFGDSITSAQTWSRAGSPHWVGGPIHIEGAGVLTIEPGARICFARAGSLEAAHGGRLVADALDTARIVLTALDADSGWGGVHLRGTPASASSLKNVVIEYTRGAYALSTHDYHAALVDSATVRQNERGVYLWGRGSRFSRSRVDTVTSSAYPAVSLGSVVTFEQNVVRGAAGVGLAVLGTNGISLLGGRIEGSGGVGLQVTTTGAGFASTQPVRVVGGASYPAELVVSAFPRIYPSVAQQDSLLGNARDTLVVTGGVLQQWAIPAPALPWHVTDSITVQYYGILAPKPGAVLVLDSAVAILAQDGGRVVARGSQGAPVLFTGHAWWGIMLAGAPTMPSYMTNVRVEHAKVIGVYASEAHPVVVDSAVFRQNGSAAWLAAPHSRINRSRVDTTNGVPAAPAVWLADSTSLESTLIRGSSDRGLLVTSNTAVVLGCEVRESALEGIDLWGDGIDVHDCNLVNNGGAGIRSLTAVSAQAQNNWWGDPAGPNGPNGDGTWGGVYASPWRTAPVVLSYVP